jgi:hypothetical protein
MNTLDHNPYVLLKNRQDHEPANEREVQFIMSTHLSPFNHMGLSQVYSGEFVFGAHDGPSGLSTQTSPLPHLTLAHVEMGRDVVPRPPPLQTFLANKLPSHSHIHALAAVNTGFPSTLQQTGSSLSEIKHEHAAGFLH